MTMIERVARAIADADQEDYMEDCIIYDKRARAAIAAMRIPSQAMVDAISNGIYDDIGSWSIWEAAIDTALNDNGETQ